MVHNTHKQIFIPGMPLYGRINDCIFRCLYLHLCHFFCCLPFKFNNTEQKYAFVHVINAPNLTVVVLMARLNIAELHTSGAIYQGLMGQDTQNKIWYMSRSLRVGIVLLTWLWTRFGCVLFISTGYNLFSFSYFIYIMTK